MKVYSISRWSFLAVCLLIAALPVSRRWKLLTGGEKATGTVMAYSMILHETSTGQVMVEFASEVRFMAGDSLCITYGPTDCKYAPGRRVRVRYDPGDPGDNCLVTFTGLYLNNYTVLPLVAIIVWAAFYLSYSRYRKKKKGEAGLPARSPYGPLDRRKELKD
jgi:hypothetical protein